MMLKKLAIFYMVYITNGWVTVNVCKTKNEKNEFLTIVTHTTTIILRQYHFLDPIVM